MIRAFTQKKSGESTVSHGLQPGGKRPDFLAALENGVLRSAMKRELLILSMVLMTASLTAPFWAPWVTGVPQRERLYGRVTGEPSDLRWVGSVVYLGDDRSTLKADGKFEFAVPQGIYVLRVCCSKWFEPIRREIQVKDKDLYVELPMEPLVEIPGHLVAPDGKQLKSLASVSARRIYTHVVKTAVVSAQGTFSLRLSKGEWKVNLENSNPGLMLKSITFGEKEIHDQTLTISDKQEPTLLEITLQ